MDHIIDSQDLMDDLPQSRNSLRKLKVVSNEIKPFKPTTFQKDEYSAFIAKIT